MKKVISLLLCVMMLTGLLAGCGGGSGGGNTDAAQGGSAQQSGTDSTGAGSAAAGRTDFIFGITSEPPLLTPFKTDEFTVFTINYQIFNRLLELTADGQLVPSLAESWTYSEDGKQMTFKLREGILFHNGEEMTSEDVAYSVNQAIAAPATSAVTSAMVEMTADDKYTCTLTLSEPFGPIEACLSSPYLGIVNKAADEADPDGYARNPIGTGPYKFVRWDIGDKIVLEANEDYWQGSPAIKDLTFKICLDTNAALVALENGEIDLCDTIPVTQKATVEGNDKIGYASAGSTATYFLQMKTDTAPFNDVRVRQAFSCAINREEAVVGACDGNAVPLDAMMLKDVDCYPADFKSAYGYDPERAKELLAEAGYDESNPLKVEFTCMDDSRMIPIAEVVAEQLRLVGVEATIERYERAAWLNKVRTEHDYLLALMNTAAQYNDADYLYGLYHSQYVGGRNWGDVNDPELDALLESGRSETDKAQRDEIYRKVVERMDEMQYAPAILQMDQPYFYNASLQGFVANPTRRCFVFDYSWS